MDIGLLGSLTVDGSPVDLPRRDRVVLAVLAMRVGEDVPADRLADALWRDEQPASWAKVVQGCVVRLRKTLGADAIRTVPQGYRLDLGTERIDAARFQRLLLRGRELLTLGEDDRAAHALEEALALWRGPALVDLDAWEPGRIEAGRLHELRLDAEELGLEAALRGGRHRELLGTARAFVDESPLRERRWALLALAQYQSGRQAEALRTLADVRTVLASELGLDPGPDLVALEAAIRQQDPSLVAAAATQVRPTCPYRGLVPFDVADAEDFFGRDRDVKACRERLAAAGAVTIVGPSGCGKSSLARAGIAAGLTRDGHRVTVITPGAHPLDAFSTVPTTGPRRALVVDQVEEVLGLCSDASERAAFFTTLAAYADRALLVVAVRGDRLGDLTGHEGFTRLVERSLYLLDPMGPEDLVAAIEGPARVAGLRLEPGLVDLLVREVEGEPGALPLLSHALRSTWGVREGATLTVEGYRSTGGVRGAVAQTAEAVYDDVPADQRDALRDLLLRLVAPSPEGAAMRSRLPRRLISGRHHDELIETLVAARLVISDEDVVELAHEALVRAWPRLQGWLDDDAEGQRILRHLVVAADSWEAMRRPDSELYRGTRLAQALGWQDRTGPDLTPTERAFLDAGRRLAGAEERSASQRAAQQRRVNRRLRGLLVGVAALSLALLAAATLAVGQAREAERRRDAAVRERNEATALGLALSSREVGGSNGALALALAVESMRATPEPLPAATAALAQARLAFDTNPGQPVGVPLDGADASEGVAFSPDGHTVAAAGEFGMALWDTTTGERLTSTTPRHIGGVSDLAFSPDGRLLATAGLDGSVRLWHAGTGKPWGAPLVRPVRGRSYWTNSLAFSPDGSHLVAVGEDGKIRLWRTASRAPLPAPDTGGQYVQSVAFGRRGSTVVTAGDLGVRAWDLVTGKERDPWPSLHDINDVALSDDGELLATVDWGGIRLWDTDTGRRVGPRVALDYATEVAFRPHGHLLAIAAEDGLRLWDPATDGRTARRITSSRAGSVAWSALGDRLAAGGYDGVQLWHPAAGDRRQEPLRGTRLDNVASVSISPRGDLVASGSLSEGTDDGVRLWDIDSRKQVARPVKDPYGVHRVAFSPAGDLLAMVTAGSDDDAVVELWDVDTGRSARSIDLGDDQLTDLAFSPDGRRLATAESRVRFWDPRTGRPVGPRILPSPGVVAITYRPDGEVLATAGIEGTVRQWDPASGAEVGVPLEHGGGVAALAYSPDGRRIATAGDGGLRLWDARTGRPVTALWQGHEGEVTALAFRPEGDLLLSAGTDGTVRVWDATTGDAVGPPLVGHTAVVTDLKVGPDGELVATASQDGTVRIWDWHPDRACADAALYLTEAQVQERVPEGWELDCDYD